MSDFLTRSVSLYIPDNTKTILHLHISTRRSAKHFVHQPKFFWILHPMVALHPQQGHGSYIKLRTEVILQDYSTVCNLLFPIFRIYILFPTAIGFTELMK